MKSLADIREEFIKTAIAHDIGRSEEDFHTYLRHQGLEHHLSETQIQDRNRNNNQLNSYALALGLPMVLAYGALKLPRGLSGIFGDTQRQVVVKEPMIEYGNSLSGINTRPMPTADAHSGQDIPNLTIPINDGVPSVNIDFSSSNYGLFPPTDL